MLKWIFIHLYITSVLSHLAYKNSDGPSEPGVFEEFVGALKHLPSKLMELVNWEEPDDMETQLDMLETSVSKLNLTIEVGLRDF